MTETEVDAVVEALLEEYRQEQEEEAALLALLHGPYRELRDQNHLEAERVLVWDSQKEPAVQSVAIHELPLQYPCGPRDEQWDLEDLGWLVKQKALLYRESVEAQENGGECGTVVLIIRSERDNPHRIITEKAPVETVYDSLKSLF